MMTQLYFRSEEVAPIVEHAIANSGQVLFVKDEGIYLMSRGGDVAYAIGFSPEVADYDKCKNAVGGDDFADPIPAKDLGWVIDAADKFLWISVTFTPDTLTFGATGQMETFKRDSDESESN